LVPLERGEVKLVEKETSARIFGPSPYILVSHTSLKQEANQFWLVAQKCRSQKESMLLFLLSH